MQQNAAIAVSGSPNTITEISVDIQEGYLSTPLLGTLVSMELSVDGHDGTTEQMIILGQLSDVKTQNRWHENPSLKNYIKRRGTLPNLTAVGDITTAQVQIIGAYRFRAGDYEKHRMSVPAGSGLALRIADRETITSIMAHEANIGYIGRFYGTKDVPAPVYARHFGDFSAGGTGEAYMGGFFGPSGCGKSVVAATMNALWARNPEMGLLILDPQSEFATNQFSKGQQFSFDFHALLKSATSGKFRPAIDVISIDQVQLDGVPLFVALLERKGFFKTLGLGSAKHLDARESLIDGLERLIDWQPASTLQHLEAESPSEYELLRESVLDACSGVYASSTRDNKKSEFLRVWDETGKQRIQKIWSQVGELFAPKDRQSGNEKTDLTTLVEQVMLHGRKVILDLDPERIELDDEFKLHIMQFVFKRISNAAHKRYKDMKGANCLIVLDEAGRFIPQTSESTERNAMAQYITAKVKELRKYRVGFQFITQNIGEIQKDIFRNLHYRVYGVGMSVGSDAEHLKSREGDEAFEMYQALPDPRLSNTYSYMVCGAILALGTTGKPMFIEGFGSDSEIVSQNGLAALEKTPPVVSSVVRAATNGEAEEIPDYMR